MYVLMEPLGMLERIVYNRWLTSSILIGKRPYQAQRMWHISQANCRLVDSYHTYFRLYFA